MRGENSVESPDKIDLFSHYPFNILLQTARCWYKKMDCLAGLAGSAGNKVEMDLLSFLTGSVDALHIVHPVDDHTADLCPRLLQLLFLVQSRLVGDHEPLHMLRLAGTCMVLVVERLQLNMNQPLHTMRISAPKTRNHSVVLRLRCLCQVVLVLGCQRSLFREHLQQNGWRAALVRPLAHAAIHIVGTSNLEQRVCSSRAS